MKGHQAFVDSCSGAYYCALGFFSSPRHFKLFVVSCFILKAQARIKHEAKK